MANFDEKSGVVPCLTPWGCWYQTMDEVMVEINVPDGTTSKAIKATFGVNTLTCSVPGVDIKGELYSRVVADECLWSLEDRKLVRLVLIKSNRQADNCWKSLLKGQYEADPLTFDRMEKKLTLQRFQYEQPGFDFSNADITGNYTGGGPQLPGN
ncbi:nudC domain-containing protein 2-like isoform X1 [Lytechinus variegatus]|uniref:nudC domain-containing protein 2-like isoform X1 n=1 Tax=Lytechinus variegatus TaxID=7654 RepID=UPI001BB1215A|nr:nudC domain-containing protein 2-like isoform X1 [Lytechinus variegatus]